MAKNNNVTITTKRRLSPATIAIIVLAILLLASIAVAATIAYFSSTQNATGTITLGDPININITQGGASVSSLTFDGNAMPGTVYAQKIGVSAPDSTSDAVLRAKLTITNTDGASTIVTASTNANWTDNVSTDGYYYYNGVLTARQSIDFVESITVPTELTNDDANKTFSVNVIVEALQQANDAASSVWDTAPEEWLEQYSANQG